MNKFAKYVPEEDKKKQREHIGAMGLSDMPFGEEVETVELVPEEKIIVPDMYGIHLTAAKPEMVEGQTYTVIFDGEEYPCVCTIYNGMGGIVYRLGNYNVVVGSAEDTGEPFWMEFEAWSDTPKIYVRVGDYDKEHTVSVYGETVVIKTIDPKYLPEGVGGGCVDIKMCAMGNILTPLDCFDCVNMETDEVDVEKMEKIFSDVDNALINNVCRIKIEPSPVQTYEAVGLPDTGCYVVNMVHNDETYGVSAFVLGFEYENGWFKDTKTYRYSAYDVKDLFGLGGEA